MMLHTLGPLILFTLYNQHLKLVLQRALIFNKAQQKEFVNVFKMYIKGLWFPLQALVLEKKSVAM